MSEKDRWNGGTDVWLREIIGQLEEVADDVCEQIEDGSGNRLRSYAVTALNDAIESIGAAVVLLREAGPAERDVSPQISPQMENPNA